MIALAYTIAAVAMLLALALWGYWFAHLLRDLGMPLPTLRGLRLRIRKQPRARLTLTDYAPDYREARMLSFSQPAKKGFVWPPKDAA